MEEPGLLSKSQAIVVSPQTGLMTMGRSVRLACSLAKIKENG